MNTPGIRLLTGGDLEIDPGLGTDLSGNLPRALFVALLLIGAEPVSREHLATLLWPESDAATARQRLRMTLHNLRRGLGPELEPALKSTQDSLSMNRGSVDIDLAAFRELGRSDTATARGLAIGLYRGDLLERFPPVSSSFDELLDHRREECRAAFLSICRHALSEDIETGDVAAYDLLLEKALRIDRTNADLVADAMRFYGAAGSAQRVMDVFDRHARALRSDIDVDPEPEISDLRDEMRALALKRMHRRVPRAFAPVSPVTHAPGSPVETTPVPMRAASFKVLAAGAGVILVAGVAYFWNAWGPPPAPGTDLVLNLRPVAATSGDCGLPDAGTMFDDATEAAVTQLKGAIVVLAGSDGSAEVSRAEVFTLARQFDCDGLNARGTLTVVRESDNEIIRLRRYDLRNAQEDALIKAINRDLQEAMPR